MRDPFHIRRLSYDAGKTLAQTAGELNRSLVVLSSTDLTHYGENYGFMPKGRGRSALTWVRDFNDAGFINAVLAGDPKETLARADKDQSACSVGAVLGVLGFVEFTGAKKGQLLEYGTSADLSGGIPGSFVGYAAISWE